MEKQPPSSAWSFAWIYPVAFVLALAVFGFGIYLAANNRGWEVLAAGCASVVAVLVTWPLALGMQSWRAGATSSATPRPALPATVIRRTARGTSLAQRCR